MKTETFSDPLAKLTPIVREIYDLADATGDTATKGKCLRLYVEIADARKALGIESVPLELLHADGRA
jgi:hypothetical protein